MAHKHIKVYSLRAPSNSSYPGAVSYILPEAILAADKPWPYLADLEGALYATWTWSENAISTTF